MCNLEEEEEEYCFKNTTIDSVETDICFCSVGGCVKPTEFDEECEYGAKILCNNCDYYISSEDFDAGNGRTMIDALDNGEYRCEVCNEKYGAKILCNDGDYYISSKDFASWSW